MGYDLYLKKVNTKKLKDKLQHKELNDLSFEDFEEITEDEINSFINVFERYFTKSDISYRHEDYFIIQQDENVLLQKKSMEQTQE